MKATLTFSLPEEETMLKDALKGGYYHGRLQEFDEYLRGRVKYEVSVPAEVQEALKQARNYLNDICPEIWEEE